MNRIFEVEPHRNTDTRGRPSGWGVHEYSGTGDDVQLRHKGQHRLVWTYRSRVDAVAMAMALTRAYVNGLADEALNAKKLQKA